MTNPTGTLFVAFCTVPSAETGRDLGRALVAEKLAACVNVIPDLISIYRWKGAIEEGSEALLMIKTGRDRLPQLQARLLELHPYETPEFIALPIEQVSPGYLDWALSAVGEPSE